MTKHCTKTCGKCKGVICKDENKYCGAWSKAGYCVGDYESFMTKKCAKSCGKCGSLYSGQWLSVKGREVAQMGEIRQ